ncbi:MAG: hypothetical protein MI807_17885 [Verrucomicrobiales bacterium]|nr:hypothetical protein [Verrucomicrobiales bacterium]
MFSNYVETDDLIGILSPGSYSPEILECVRATKDWERLDGFLGRQPRLGITGTIESSYVDATTPGAVPYITTKQINDVLVYPKDCKYISTDADQEWSKCRVKDGDILICKSGKVGAAGLLRAKGEKNCNSVSDVINVRLREGCEVDPFFLALTFNSPWVRSQLQQQSGGAVFDHVSIYAIPELKFPACRFEIQAAIGSKIRKAERLRQIAGNCEREVDGVFQSAVPSYPSVPEIVSWVDTSTLTERMDPQPYRTHALALLEAIRSIPHGVVEHECQISGGCAVPSDEFLEDDGIPLIRIRDIGERSFDPSGTFVSQDFYAANSKYAASESEIVVGMDGNFRAQFFLDSDLPAFINQRVAIIQAEGVRAEFLAAWLNRPEGQIQLYRTSVKTTVEHISLVDIRNVLFPRFGDGEENRLADLIRANREFIAESSRLVEKAKEDVEGLIEGTLNEDTLLEESAQIEKWLNDNPTPNS